MCQGPEALFWNKSRKGMVDVRDETLRQRQRHVHYKWNAGFQVEKWRCGGHSRSTKYEISLICQPRCGIHKKFLFFSLSKLLR